MSKPSWAREKVEGSAVAPSLSPRQISEVVIMLKAERARARRVVRELKREYDSSYGGYIAACDELLRRLK